MEETKVALKPQTIYSKTILFLLHLIPIGLSVGLIILNARQTYWLNLGFDGLNAKLNALLFVSKAHETLVMLSLSEIVLNLCRQQLVGENGLPFSLILYPFQINSYPIHLRQQLWSLINYKPWSVFMRSGILGLIVFMLISVTTIGPLSAVLALPKLGFWDASIHDGTLYFLDNISDTVLWPTTVSASLIPQICLNSTQRSFTNPRCPYAGFDRIEMELKQYASMNILNTSMTDLTYSPRPLTAVFGEIIVDLCGLPPTTNTSCNATPLLSWSIATTPSLKLMSDLVALVGDWTSAATGLSLAENDMIVMGGNLKSGVWQPFVQTNCLTADWTVSEVNNRTTIAFPGPAQEANMGLFEASTPYKQIEIPKANMSFASVENLDFSTPGLRWVELEANTANNTVGLIVNLSEQDGSVTQSNILTCTMEAQWIPSEMWAFLNTRYTANRPIYISIVDPFAPETFSLRASKGRKIEIKKDWLDIILGNYSVMEYLAPLPLSYANPSSQIAKGLSLALVDNLARLNSDATAKLLSFDHDGGNGVCSVVLMGEFELGESRKGNDPFPENLDHSKRTLNYIQSTYPDWSERSLIHFRQGYSWSLQGFLAKMAVIVFGLQIGITLAYLVFTIRFSKSRVVSWGSPEELLTLALCTNLTKHSGKSNGSKMMTNLPLTTDSENTLKDNMEIVNTIPLDEEELEEDPKKEFIEYGVLKNTSAGINQNQTWQLRMRIREVVGTHQLTLVVDNPATEDLKDSELGVSKICMGKKYG